MKSNKRAVIVLMTVFVFLLIGGGILMQAVNNRDTEEKEQLMTPEELIEYFGFTEEEIEGIDIDKMIQEFGITRDYLFKKEVKREEMLRSFAFFPKKSRKIWKDETFPIWFMGNR